MEKAEPEKCSDWCNDYSDAWIKHFSDPIVMDSNARVSGRQMWKFHGAPEGGKFLLLVKSKYFHKKMEEMAGMYMA